MHLRIAKVNRMSKNIINITHLRLKNVFLDASHIYHYFVRIAKMIIIVNFRQLTQN
jgi:hypothetical protein